MFRGYCTAVLALAFSLAAAQSPPVKLDIDFASFAYDEDNSLLELYLAIGSSTLDYRADSVGLVAELPIYVRLDHATVTTLLGSTPESVWADSMLLQFSLTDSSFLAEGKHFVHQIRALVPPGEYALSLDIPAAGVRAQKLAVKRDVLIPDYSDTSNPMVSDIEFATSIARAKDRTDEFYKNGLSIKPNPYFLFGASLPKLFYYFEAYNPGAESEESYTVYTFISRSSLPQPVSELQNRTTRKVRSPDAVVGSFDISGLVSGSYLLNVVLLDGSNRSLVNRSRKFFVYNPSVEAQRVTAAVDIAYEKSLYASMPDDELDEQIGYAVIIATNLEEKALKSAKNEEGKRDALLDFWSKRDPDPRTPINEVREEYFSRIQYVRERYSNSHTDGWESDRGRVYLKYGAPANVNPRHYETGMPPYEIWEYDNIPGEGNSMFVFADISGFSEFELIHSSVPGERQSLDWKQELRDRK
ncbi:MAG: GWxTD domain-containing protein [Rhodothermia bacterium]